MLALDDSDPEIRIRAAVALERLGVPNRLIGQIETGTASSEAAEVLTKFGLAGARELLAEQLLHPSPLVRRAVIEAVQRAGRRDLASELIASRPARRRSRPAGHAFDTLRHLGAAGTRARRPGRAGRPRPRCPHRRYAAGRRTGRGGSGQHDPAPHHRSRADGAGAAAAGALGQIQASDAQPELARLLKDPVPEVRAAATDGVGGRPRRLGRSELLNLLGDADGGSAMARRARWDAWAMSVVPALLRSFRPEHRGCARSSPMRSPGSTSISLPGLLDVLSPPATRDSRLGKHRPGHLSGSSPGQLDMLDMRLAGPEAPRFGPDGRCTRPRRRSERAAALLLGGLNDPDAGVRARAVDALAATASADAGKGLLSLLRTIRRPRCVSGPPWRSAPCRTGRRGRALLAGLPFRRAAPRSAPRPPRVGAYDRESIVAQVLGMVDEDPVREFLRDRLQTIRGYRLMRDRLRESRQIELRALASLNRDQMEASLVEGMRGVRTRPNGCGWWAPSMPSRASGPSRAAVRRAERPQPRGARRGAHRRGGDDGLGGTASSWPGGPSRTRTGTCGAWR